MLQFRYTPSQKRAATGSEQGLDNTASFGAWLRGWREALDLTHEALAQRVGANIDTIRAWEADHEQPSPAIVETLANALRVPLSRWPNVVQHAATVGGTRDISAMSSTEPAPGLASSRLIGRDRDIAAIADHLRLPDVRVLTLLGPGGVGKTSLSQAVAEQLADEFAHGTVFVGLSAVQNPDAVAATIAQAVGVVSGSAEPVRTMLLATLAPRHMLLVLDNFEHVLDAAPLIADLLGICPRLKVLVTSRAVLHLHEEWLYHVKSLALPDLSALPATQEIAVYGAVALFVMRARAVKPDFVLTDENAAAVAAICAEVDGLPLAIELVAARSNGLPPPALLDHLKRRIALLRYDRRDVPSQNDTLRNAIDWSYDLLDEETQALFARLSVFVGGWTLVAAEMIAGQVQTLHPHLRSTVGIPAHLLLSATFDPEGLDVLSGLHSLVRKHLVLQSDEAEGEVRFTMLETIREYAVEQLAARGEAEAVQRRHATFFLALAEEAEPGLSSPEQVTWVKRLDRDHHNFRAALDWALRQDEAELAVRLAGALWRFWYMQGHFSEGFSWLSQALDLAGDNEAGVSASARARALNGAGNLAYNQGDYATARSLHEQSLALRRALDDRWGVAASLNNLGLIARMQAEYEQAQSLFEEAARFNRQLNNRTSEAINLNNLGNVAIDQGDTFAAMELHQESYDIFTGLGNTWGRAMSLSDLGIALLLREDRPRAQQCFEESLALQRTLGDRRNIAISLGNLGLLALMGNDVDAARSYYHESLTLRYELNDKIGIAECLEGLAALHGLQRRAARAARLWGMAETLRAAIGSPQTSTTRAVHRRPLAAVRAQLGAKAFAAAWAEGQAMTIDQAVTDALSDEAWLLKR